MPRRVTWVSTKLWKRPLIPLPKSSKGRDPSPILFKGPKSRILGEKCQSSWEERKGRPYTITESLARVPSTRQGSTMETGRSLYIDRNGVDNSK